MTNQLSNEKSPYLKQHEKNPVNWLPWNKETLKKAKDEKKPIFLSIGYASCHWCHVMAHESFENIDTAKIMNDKFINIKVDREERPDLDFIFQKSLGILTGAQGGWPLSMFLDENGVPFTGGTYFPPKELQGRPSFNSVLENVSKVYSENREKIISQVSQMKLVFKELNIKNSVLKQDLEPLAEKIIQYMDKDNGGFQGAPKFPQFYIFETLLYFYLKNKNKNFLDPVKNLLKNISSKGIYDHLDGGISRYTVDEKWIVPHFEKMLYDNILFVKILNIFVNYSKDNYFKNKLSQTINFINSDFKNKNNLLGSAYDADSEGVEGKFYTWKYEELKNILDKDLELLKKKYEITENGNFEGLNIFVEKNNHQLTVDQYDKIKKIEDKLKNIRDKRIKPFFDDKTQTDLNSYWIYSILHSSFILNDKKLFDQANEYFNNLKKILSKNVFHCYNKDRKEIDVFLEDYSYFCLLLVSMYEIKNDKESIKLCSELMKYTWENFYDEENVILQKNIKTNNDLFVKPIDIIDNNIPNGNSIFLLVCNKLFNITGDTFWEEKIINLKKSFHSFLNNSFSQMFSYIKIIDICEQNLTITFHGNNEKLKQIKEILIKDYFETATFIYKNNENESFVIVCKNQTCSEKLKDIEDVKKYLNEKLI